ncbi:hypothetical protein WG906_02755 [Pedobacter sp. P351]|uniref:hypothetical protein n=1 Tax=Pedobacter superstes TaxID=3133441 RepID=UPI0030AA82F6
MESTSDNNKTIKENETGKTAESDGFNETLKPADDSFKTSPRKHRLSWETPHDEQMLDSQNLSEKDEGGD